MIVPIDLIMHEQSRSRAVGRTCLCFPRIEKCPIRIYNGFKFQESMPKVKCFNIPGLECWFWSNDHNPPHFHAKRRGEWEIRVEFSACESRMFELVRGRRPSEKLLKQLAKLVKDHRADLLFEWEKTVNQ